jgi:hypothetical protein
VIGARTVDDSIDFMADLKSRLAGRVQLMTDGLKGKSAAFSKKIENHAAAIAIHFMN